ncbi:alpha-ribazole phosphatase [Desertivirga brevis]|uniref:alpha-ribazole phosphatase n=1 Tax=Desertivirga brevis TaxID=2810310 RepID=UPI001A979814|nr:alpha-ribazole phosphatase [Pedobacter sp. SYSU D00873]
MEVYLIRHTQPQLSKGLIYGRKDLPLADSFQEELEAVLRSLPEDIDVVYSSPSQRCYLLAEAISSRVICDERLFELNFGDWEGKTWDTIDRKASEFWMEDYMNRCPPAGETMLEMKDRVELWWEELKAAEHQKTVVVTHGGVIRLLMALAGQIAIENIWERAISFGEVIYIRT